MTDAADVMGGANVTVSRRWGARLLDALPAAALFVGALAVWEVLVRALGIQGFILPAPSAIVAALVGEWPVLWRATTATVAGALAGLAVGALAASVVAVASVRWSSVRSATLPLAVAANSTPIIVLAPVANAWFGLTNPVSTISVVAVLVFFPILINLVAGLLSASASHHELMGSYAAGRRDVLRLLQLPSALPYAFSALKVAAPLSLIGAIVKEYFGGPQERLGQYITSRAALFQFDSAWAAIVMASAFGIAIYLVVIAAERVAMPWHVSIRGAA